MAGGGAAEGGTEAGVAATEPQHGERAGTLKGIAAAGGCDGAAAWRTGGAGAERGGAALLRGAATEPQHGERAGLALRGAALLGGFVGVGKNC